MSLPRPWQGHAVRMLCDEAAGQAWRLGLCGRTRRRPHKGTQGHARAHKGAGGCRRAHTGAHGCTRAHTGVQGRARPHKAAQGRARAHKAAQGRTRARKAPHVEALVRNSGALPPTRHKNLGNRSVLSVRAFLFTPLWLEGESGGFCDSC